MCLVVDMGAVQVSDYFNAEAVAGTTGSKQDAVDGGHDLDLPVPPPAAEPLLLQPGGHQSRGCERVPVSAGGDKLHHPAGCPTVLLRLFADTVSELQVWLLPFLTAFTGMCKHVSNVWWTHSALSVYEHTRGT